MGRREDSEYKTSSSEYKSSEDSESEAEGGSASTFGHRNPFYTGTAFHPFDEANLPESSTNSEKAQVETEGFFRRKKATNEKWQRKPTKSSIKLKK